MTMTSHAGGGGGAMDRRPRGGGDFHGGGGHRHHHGGGGGGDKDSDGGGGRSSGGSAKYDDPPNSRLFIVCGKGITEEQFKEAFGEYGAIEEVWVLKDRVTGEPKGVTYIKFSKTSEAALAMEEMNGRCVAGSPRPLKVLIAHSRDQGSRRDMNEEERLLRLFVVVAKTMAEQELREHFARFGDIDYVSIVRDRGTKESKGFAYVKFHRMSHAAKAFEECDRSFRPVFADPKPQKSSYHDGSAAGSSNGAPEHHSHHGGGGGGGGGHRGNNQGGFGCGPGSTASGSTSASISASYDLLSYMDTSGANPEGVCRLSVSASPSVNQDQLWKLFDLVPGLDYCDRPREGRSSAGGGGRGGKGLFTVVYNNPQSATYAKEKLHGFEYPPGHRMVVRFDQSFDGQGGQGHGGHSHYGSPQMGYNRGGVPPPPGGFVRGAMAPPAAPAAAAAATGGRPANLQNDLAHLTETIANATALLQAAGYAAPGAAPLVAPAGPSAAQQQAAAAAASAAGLPPGVPHVPVAAAAAPAPAPGALAPGAAGETYDPSYCSVKLPAPQPLAAMDSVVEERLFIVCTPVPPQPYALKDVFGRFGCLIDIYMLNGKTCGYAKYASKDSADRAVAALHGQEICGSRLKVMQADPQDKSASGAGGDSARKRAKISQGDS